MKSLALLVLPALLLASTSAEAKYMPPPAWDLLLGSDVVATGKITGLTKDTYTLRLSRVLHGASLPGQTLTIKKRHDWPCAVRQVPYAIGQDLMVMLAETDTQGVFRTRSAGFEAELFLRGDVVLWSGRAFDKLPNASFRVPVGKKSRKVEGREVSLTALAASLQNVRRCHKIKLRRESFFSSVKARVACPRKEHKALQKDPVYRDLSAGLLKK